MQKRTFYRLWLTTAFWHPFGVADYLSTALGILLPILGKLHPTWGAAMSDLAWQIPLTALGTLFGARLVLAPYWLYAQRDSDALTQETALQKIIRGQASQLDTRQALAKERIKRKNLCEELTSLFQEGDGLLKTILKAKKERPEELADWEARVTEFLGANLGHIYVARFSSEVGKTTYPRTATNATRASVDALNSELGRLQNFIEELCLEIDT